MDFTLPIFFDLKDSNISEYKDEHNCFQIPSASWQQSWKSKMGVYNSSWILIHWNTLKMHMFTHTRETEVLDCTSRSFFSGLTHRQCRHRARGNFMVWPESSSVKFPPLFYRLNFIPRSDKHLKRMETPALVWGPHSQGCNSSLGHKALKNEALPWQTCLFESS